MQIGRVLIGRKEFDEAERTLTALMDESRAMGSSATVYETALHLAQCVIGAGRPRHGLEIIEHAASETTEDVTIFDASRAVVAAKALIDLGCIDEATDTIASGRSWPGSATSSSSWHDCCCWPAGSGHRSIPAWERQSRPRKLDTSSTGSAWSARSWPDRRCS